MYVDSPNNTAHKKSDVNSKVIHKRRLQYSKSFFVGLGDDLSGLQCEESILACHLSPSPMHNETEGKDQCQEFLRGRSIDWLLYSSFLLLRTSPLHSSTNRIHLESGQSSTSTFVQRCFLHRANLRVLTLFLFHSLLQREEIRYWLFPFRIFPKTLWFLWSHWTTDRLAITC